MLRITTVAFVSLLLAACGGGNGGDPPPPPPGGDAGGVDTGTPPGAMCAERPPTSLIFYGTLEPTHLAMSPGQVMAVAFMGGRCSGTVIADEWLLTAKHCGARVGDQICVGANPSRPNVCFRLSEVHNHPGVDATVARLDSPASERIPELVPVPIATERIGSSWIGRMAEAGGYGQTETGGFGTRKFAAVPIAMIDGEFVVINGEGTRGVCGGDSGGPLFIQANDGTIRVVAELLGGSDSCTGFDAFTRVDVLTEWIEGFTGPTIAVGGSCAAGDLQSRCVDGAAVYCDGTSLVREPCDVRCGYEPSVDGFRCITGDDPCGGVDGIGVCDGNVARWCQGGRVVERDCDSCDSVAVCGASIEHGGAMYCKPDPCMGVSFMGRCTGAVAEWCDEGTLMRVDCAERGETCGFVDDLNAYFCN